MLWIVLFLIYYIMTDMIIWRGENRMVDVYEDSKIYAVYNKVPRIIRPIVRIVVNVMIGWLAIAVRFTYKKDYGIAKMSIIGWIAIIIYVILMINVIGVIF